MRISGPEIGWLRGLFSDWGAMAGAGQRIGALTRMSDDELIQKGYRRETLVLQVYREHGIGIDDDLAAPSTADARLVASLD